VGILQKVSFDDISNKLSFLFKGSKSIVINPLDVVLPGTIFTFSGANAPSGFILCDGRAVSRSLYSKLFANLGTSSGSGDGSTTFNIPDLRGRFIRGVDGTAGVDPDKATRVAMNPGGNTGNNVGSVQANATAVNTLSLVDANLAHSHTIGGDGAHGHSSNAAANPVPQGGYGLVTRSFVGQFTPAVDYGGEGDELFATATPVALSIVGVLNHSHSGNTGGGLTTHAHGINGANETRPVNAYLIYIIKT
jgi:phage-related tail fiber protein